MGQWVWMVLRLGRENGQQKGREQQHPPPWVWINVRIWGLPWNERRMFREQNAQVEPMGEKLERWIHENLFLIPLRIPGKMENLSTKKNWAPQCPACWTSTGNFRICHWLKELCLNFKTWQYFNHHIWYTSYFFGWTAHGRCFPALAEGWGWIFSSFFLLKGSQWQTRKVHEWIIDSW